jgi:diguanylate cyclase (GGDEF)-like protein
MDMATGGPDFVTFAVEGIGTLLFGLVFLFLWKQSRIVFFGLWAAAWAIEALALFFGYQLLRTHHTAWLAPYAVFEFSFAILLIAAARAGFSGAIRDWRIVLRLIAILPIFVALVYALGWTARVEGFHAAHALVLCMVYLYNYMALRRGAGIGGRVFRFSLLLLSIAFMEHAMVLIYLAVAGSPLRWVRYLHFEAYYDFALNSVLAFAAMAMWIESQNDRIREVGSELARVRRESAANMDLDRLTGLLNQAALARRVESGDAFAGVVAVCDMDNFKEVNDRYGHLVGDEILRNIGHLLRSSIRQDDEAFRWGGDEFVILFNDQRAEVARNRMSELSGRLRDFRVRGFGQLPISFSWGIAESQDRPLRDALDEADHSMYSLKRSRPNSPTASA